MQNSTFRCTFTKIADFQIDTLLKKYKVDYLFTPNVREIYKSNIKKIKIKNEDIILCAKKRKGHFQGVLSVMNRLLSLIKSRYVFMGEKDYQQQFLIKKYLGKNFYGRCTSWVRI